MKWAIDLLRDGLQPLGAGENILKLLTIINDDNERLIELVTDLLDYSRIESGKVKLECVRLDMVALLYECQSRLRLMAERGRVGIALHLDDAIPQVWADSEKLRQVFTNLLHNAVKFSPPDTAVTVRVVVAPRQFGEKHGVVCKFSDQGIGVPPEELDRIFDKFHRVKDPKTKNVPGAGLGLSISKSIIELHGGRITVERNAGPGTTFTVVLPLREE
jgi:signal transduction histidine kinase